MEHIDVERVLKMVVDSSGKSRQQVSSELGRFRTYIQTTLGKKTVPGLAVTAQICDVCGYDLVLVNRKTDERFLVDPPK